MRNTVGKTLLALIAALLVADPVFACCFPVPADETVSVTRSDEPPCHGARSAQTNDVTPKAPTAADPSCPGCGDCAAVMTASDPIQSIAATSTSRDDQDLKGVALVNEIVTNTCAPAPPEFPSGHPPRTADTPVSLRQRLLT